MTTTDFSLLLQWWFVLLVIGAGFFPVSLFFFSKFFDKGYIFAKIFGVIILSYLVFIFGILHIAPFTQSTILLLFMASIAVAYYFCQKKELFIFLKQSWKILVAEEILFLLCLLFWSWIRSFSPDIHGLEKYMDFGFINSILRTDYFPPKDMWFTPFSINYYYFGHIATAVLTRMSNIASNYTYNFMLASIFALCFTATFSLAANLYETINPHKKLHKIKRTLSGLLTASLVTFAGNLHILYAFFSPYANDAPVPLWKLIFQPELFPNNYWYPNATRFIFNTIHEFPMYSWVVSDLHGHVLDIPVVLLIMALIFTLFLAQKKQTEKNNNPRHSRADRNPAKLMKIKQQIIDVFTYSIIDIRILVLLGFLLAVAYMTNAWDGAIYLLLSASAIVYLFWKKTPIINIIFPIIFITVCFMLFSFPYNYFFKPFASGIGILCASDSLTSIQKIGPFLFEKNHCQHSLWWQMLLLYGFFFFFIASFFFFIAKMKKLLPSDKFIIVLSFVGLLLIIIPEFIYLKDIYPAHYRANTMFKLVFQAFIMLSIVSGYTFVRIISSIHYNGLSMKKRTLYVLYLIISILLIILVLLYPQLAINSYYGNLKDYKGLNGTAYLKTLYPTDTKGILWLNKYVSGQPVILEAQSDSYTDYGRVSVHTGLPTVLGWTVHEWLWRGEYGIPAPRIEEIKKMYESPDQNEVKKLLDKYHVEYVFIGNLEYQKYPTLQEATFKKLGKKVFQQGNTKIYQIQ